MSDSQLPAVPQPVRDSFVLIAAAYPYSADIVNELEHAFVLGYEAAKAGEEEDGEPTARPV